MGMEWTVVTVLIALIGLGGAIIKPVVSLTQSITKLTVIVDALQNDMNTMISKNSDAHERIWRKNEEHDLALQRHDIKIGEHDTRIRAIENGVK